MNVPFTDGYLDACGSVLAMADGRLSRADVAARTAPGSGLAALADELTQAGWSCKVVSLQAALAEGTTPIVAPAHDGRGIIVLQLRGGRAWVEDSLGSASTVTFAELVASCDEVVLQQRWSSNSPKLRGVVAAALWGSWRKWLAGAALGGGLALSELLPSALTAVLLDRVMPFSSWGALGGVALLLLLVGVVRVALTSLRSTHFARAEIELLSKVLADQYGRLLRQSWARVARGGTGAPVEAAEQVETALRSLPERVLSILHDVPLVLVATLAMAWVDGLLAVMAAAFCIVSIAVSMAFSYMQGRRETAVLQLSSTAQSRLLQVLEGAQTLASGPAVRELFRRFRTGELERGQAELQSAIVATRRCSASRLLQTGLILTVTWVVSSAALAGTLSVGQLIALFGLASTLAAATQSLSDALSKVVAAVSPLRRCEELAGDELDFPSSAQPHRGNEADSAAAVRLQGVWFRHSPDAAWLLQDFSLEVGAGSLYPLRGRSGCGKTTLLRLLAGLLQPERGDVSIMTSPARAGSRLVSYLPCDTPLVEGSLRKNLELLSNASWVHIVAIAERTGLANWAARLPMGFETVVAARGRNLSSGERQLVLLTAAAATTSPVVLLDEPLANMDEHQKSRIDLHQLFAGRTVLCATHEEEAA